MSTGMQTCVETVSCFWQAQPQFKGRSANNTGGMWVPAASKDLARAWTDTMSNMHLIICTVEYASVMPGAEHAVLRCCTLPPADTWFDSV